MAQTDSRDTKVNWMIDRLWRVIIWGALRMPPRLRISAMGWFFASIAGPLSGRRAMAERNLAMVFPEMSAPERRRVARAVLNNVGRMVIESYDPADMLARAAAWVPEGPGWPEVEAAQAEGRPILFVSGHYGNYGAARATLNGCLLYTSPSPRDRTRSRMPSSA